MADNDDLYDALNLLTVTKLKAQLKKYGLSSTGKKAILVRRLQQHQQSQRDSTESGSDDNEDQPQAMISSMQQHKLKIKELQLELQILKMKQQGQPSTPTASEQMQKMVTLNSLPRLQPSVFTGDPFKYNDWNTEFTAMIHDTNLSIPEKIYYLKQYVGGKAKDCIIGYLQQHTEQAYEDAKQKLKERFGNKFVAAEAFRNRLSTWPIIKNKDAEGLQMYGDFLKQCSLAKQTSRTLNILDDCREILQYAQRLPEWAMKRWSNFALNYKKQNDEYPLFDDFATFVSDEAEKAVDPVFSMGSLKSGHISHPTVCGDNSHELPMKKTVKSNAISSTLPPTSKENSLTPNNDTVNCYFCNMRNHETVDCGKFGKLAHHEKQTFIKDNGLCYGCLRPGHLSSKCVQRALCSKCSKAHPTSLHFNTTVAVDDKEPHGRQVEKVHTPDASSSATCHSLLKNDQQKRCMAQQVTTMILPVWLSSTNNPTDETLVYALIDSQSDTTFMLDSAAPHLADGKPAQLQIATMTSKQSTVSCLHYTALQIRGFNSQQRIPLNDVFSTCSIPVDTRHIPTPETATQWNHLQHLQDHIAPYQQCPAALLIGYNCSEASKPLKVVTSGKLNQPYAVQTPLGWTIIGSHLPNDNSTALCTTHRMKTKLLTNEDVLKSLEDSLYDDSSSQKISLQDVKFTDIMKSTICRKEGFYCMPLPFKNYPDKPSLLNNRSYAISRLNHLQRKFKDSRYFESYSTFINTMIKNGEAERVPIAELDMECAWYIPHHGVYHPRKPEKLRVVFDCSAKFKGQSLNDHLLEGPDLLNNLLGVLLRFRQHRIAFMADIERMFYRFKVADEDRNYLRFLWIDPDNCQSYIDYRMTVHLFGASSSPGCSNYAFKQLAKDNASSHPKAASFIMNNFYMDDGLKSTSSTKEAIHIIHQTRDLCKIGNLRLHKFISNDATVLHSIPPEERAIDTTLPLPIQRALGISWNIETDEFTFQPDIKPSTSTRRGVLSTVASLYDPFGFISPFTLIGKRILQNMCKEKAGWDTPLSSILEDSWQSWVLELQYLGDVRIPRCVHGFHHTNGIKVELHNFSDASLQGIGQCSYLKIITLDGQISTNLLMSKSKVPPRKVTTVPRLELTAAVLSIKVSTFITQELGYTDLKVHFWTDSQAVLGYIQNDSRRFHTYVSNRVQKIRNCSEPEEWHFINSKENPADIVSRGCYLSKLVEEKTWLDGPAFLKNPDVAYGTIADIVLSKDDPEVKTVSSLNTKCTLSVDLLGKFKRFSTWNSLINAFSLLIRYVKNVKGISCSKLELNKAANILIIQYIQHNYFEDLLQKGNTFSLSALNPYLDDQNIFRVGGRLRYSSYPTAFKHPIILPKNCHVTELIVKHYHSRIGHQGRNSTINKLRAEGYHIVKGTNCVSSIIHKCVTCRKLRGTLSHQHMADLPQARVEKCPPFTHSGLDCFGPFLVREGRKEHKKYGIIFTCLYSRAVHLEVLDDLSSDSLINSLRCFIAIRGSVRTLRSDQGTNFVGASNELLKAFTEMTREKMQLFLADQQCTFEFNIPSASHMGGIWERMIRTIRSIMAGLMTKSSGRLNTTGLRTLMYEVMAIINSRPISILHTNPSDEPEPLTPNHLLTMKVGAALPPPGNFDDADLYSRKRWRTIQSLAETFWHRWRHEYLSTLQKRQKWNGIQRNMKVDDIVYIKDENLLRQQWRMGRVVNVHPSKDGLIRKLTLQTRDSTGEGKSTTIDRPVTKCILLIPNDA